MVKSVITKIEGVRRALQAGITDTQDIVGWLSKQHGIDTDRRTVSTYLGQIRAKAGKGNGTQTPAKGIAKGESEAKAVGKASKTEIDPDQLRELVKRQYGVDLPDAPVEAQAQDEREPDAYDLAEMVRDQLSRDGVNASAALAELERIDALAELVNGSDQLRRILKHLSHLEPAQVNAQANRQRPQRQQPHPEPVQAGPVNAQAPAQVVDGQ